MILDAALKPIIWNETTPEVFGLDNLEGVRGPVMFISNHSSHLDASIILTTLPHSWREKTATAAAKDYFFDVWWRSAFTALVYAGFPVERGAGEKATAKAKELIRDGWNIIVFPEGTRSTDGWLQRFRHGTSRLALDMKMPVVPIAIVGAYAAMPKGRSWPRKGRPPIRVRYGRPIYPREGETHQQLSLRMQQGVAELFDEDRTSWWEAARRAAKDETPSSRRPGRPGWLRTWEGSRPIRRSGKPPDLAMTRTGGEVRRHALIEEAIRAFGREGYSGASLDQIATAVGIRKQTLLYYFPTKDALLEACLQAAGQRVAEEIASALEGKETYWDKAEAVIHAVFALAEEWPEFPMFVREAGRLGADGIERFTGALEPLRLRAIAFLQDGMDAGEIRKQDPALLLFMLYTAVVGSLTEASVLNAVVGEDKGRQSLRMREREVQAFVRSALQPA